MSFSEPEPMNIADIEVGRSYWWNRSTPPKRVLVVVVEVRHVSHRVAVRTLENTVISKESGCVICQTVVHPNSLSTD